MTIWTRVDSLLTWIKFDPSIDKDKCGMKIHYKMRDEITYPFPNFSDSPLKLEWINGFFFTVHVVIYPCWD